MRAACERGVFQGLQIPNGGPVILHLLYADDALFLGEWSEHNIKNLARILHCFHVSSGLRVNFNKSRVFGVGFLWGSLEGARKIHWASWDKVTASKEAGGLGIGTIKSLNVSLIAKWWWRLRAGLPTTWANVITGLHDLNLKPNCYYANNKLPGVWKNIAGVSKELMKKGIAIDRILKKQSSGPGDSWICSLASDGSFTVKVLRKVWDHCSPISIGQFEWTSDIPIKVVCFVWRARMGNIPTAMALSKRGENLENGFCSLYGDVQECANHALVHCQYARTVCEWIFKWCGVPTSTFLSVCDVIEFATNWFDCPLRRKLLLGICYGSLWHI
ncbi:unnamed protein product [Lactuca saligna]|uniref:Reverse transcriptase zinc-binding domain-containing protein n=1 Tax=Lactuca saligna TaxID=75948 RepID=A0AA36DXN7_LACSI|nr:unnamed protein product [Lactuca saligna]